MPAPHADARRRRLVRAALVPYALLVLAASLYPSVPAWAAGGADRAAHFLAYLVLGALLALSLGVAARDAAGRPLPGGWWRAGGALLIGACYGAGLEALQRFTGRVPELDDVAADLLGAAAGVVGATLFSRLRGAA